MILILLWIALAGLAAAAVGAAFARRHWVLDLLTHFRMHYTLSGGVLFVLFLSQQEIGGAIASAAIALWQGLVWRDIGPAPDRVAAKAKSSTTFLAVNLQWTNLKHQRAIEALRAASADILILSEPRHDWLPHIDGLEDIYPYRSSARWPAASGPQILSRLPILRSQTYYPLAEGKGAWPAGPSRTPSNIAARFSFEETVVAISEGFVLTLLGIHAPSPSDGPRSAMRNVYLERVASHCARIEGPLLLAGDFNLTPWSPFYSDFIRATGLVNAARGRLATWPAWLGPLGIPIDHALLRGSLSLVHIASGPDLGSDHLPLKFALAAGKGIS